jgi:hypothetical protein
MKNRRPVDYYFMPADLSWYFGPEYKKQKALYCLQQCTSDIDRAASRPIILLTNKWWNFIRSLLRYDDDLFELYANSRVGPSKGWKTKLQVERTFTYKMNKRGLLVRVVRTRLITKRVAIRQNGVVCRGRNLLHAVEEAESSRGRTFIRIEAISEVPITVYVNETDTPHLVHHMYIVNQEGKAVTTDNRRDRMAFPIIDEGTELWLPKDECRMIGLPRLITARIAVSIRETPDEMSPIISSIQKGAVVKLAEILPGPGGVWGRLWGHGTAEMLGGSGPWWVPLRLSGINPFENADL